MKVPGGVLLEVLDNVEGSPRGSLHLQQPARDPPRPDQRRIRGPAIRVLFQQVQDQRETVDAAETAQRK